MRIPTVLACTLLCATALPAVPPPASPEAEDDVLAPAVPPAPKANPAAARYWEAVKVIRDGPPADWPKARALLKQATDAEFSHAQVFVGLCLLNGQNGYKKSPQQAANLFLLAAGQGNGFARFNLGLCYLNGTGVGRDRAKARDWFMGTVTPEADFSAPPPPADFYPTPSAGTAAAPATLSGGATASPEDRTRASAHAILGDLYSSENKLVEAQNHYIKAATSGAGGRAGIYEAAIKAAINYAFGQGVARDPRKADELLTQSKKLLRRSGLSYAHSLVEKKFVDDFAQADLEEEIADTTDKVQSQIQFSIAGSFADPKSKFYDAREAVKWYELSAESGKEWAMLSLAFLYHEGRLGKPDPVKAFEWFKQAAEKGDHTLGWANLSICYERGLGVAADHEKAAAIWKKHRVRDIVCHLGSIGQCPTEPLTYEEECALNLTWAKQKQDAHAQYLMGIRYQNGWGVKQDIKTAVDWFRKAAKAGDGEALCDLGYLYDRNGDLLGVSSKEEAQRKAFECYEKSATTGNVRALANLGYNYDKGSGCIADTAKAIAAYEKCVLLDPKFERAHNNLGAIYERLTGKAKTDKNFVLESKYTALMFECYRKADQCNSDYGAYNLGGIAYAGIYQKIDLQAAYTYFESAAARGYPAKIVQYKLGQMLEKGEGMPASLREAAYHYRLAALDGSQDALVRLCDIYITKPGFAQNPDRAIYWLSILARQRNVGAMVAIGDALLRKGDYADAYRYFKSMAEADIVYLQGSANERLSRFHRNGWGVKPNPGKAAKYLKKALDLGDRDALFQQARDLLQAGKTKEGIPLLRQACKAGLAGAIYTIGTLYIKGEGVEMDAELGYACLQNAADGGDVDAMVALVEGTLQHRPKALSVDEAFRYAEMAETCNHPRAAALLEQLEAMRPAQSTPAPTENVPARST